MDKPWKIVVADGAFEDLSQEEIDEIMAEMESMIESGELFENAEPLDMDQLAIDDPELHEKLSASLDMMPDRVLH
jgi:hypothetical protein